ncbi:uncharacterized protein L201_002391 [Kwoniella dendrophila CBS 6074]|uniref:Uncharacterized protein n=1 Tax=Kwoniella dendrophila CBS 6074 TaxID=1295534 RepID=A0AAX4JR11_9TREE
MFDFTNLLSQRSTKGIKRKQEDVNWVRFDVVEGQPQTKKMMLDSENSVKTFQLNGIVMMNTETDQSRDADSILSTQADTDAMEVDRDSTMTLTDSAKIIARDYGYRGACAQGSSYGCFRDDLI